MRKSTTSLSDVSSLWRRRSRTLAAALLKPYRPDLILAGVLIRIRSAATLAIPYLVGLAVDQGIRGGNAGRLEFLSGLLLGAVCQAAISQYAFMRVSGRIGQNILLDLRMLIFRHVQELSLSFYERYTSGRIIARLTSDIDSLTELLNTGLTSLLTSLISVVAIAAILLRLDLRLGLVTLLAFPLVVALTQWFRSNSERAYRAVRRAIALVIVHYTESLAGIRAVHAYGREPRNQEIFEDVNDRYRAANVWTTNLASVFGPAINMLGRITTAGVLVYGGYLVVQGQLTLGVLTAFRPLRQAVFRADAGAVAVLQPLPGGCCGAGEAGGGDGGDRLGPGAHLIAGVGVDRRIGPVRRGHLRLSREGGDRVDVGDDPGRPGGGAGGTDRCRQVDHGAADLALLRPHLGDDPP